jgi:hypothetical protein
MSARTNQRLEDVAAAMDDYLRRADEDLEERLPDLEDELHDLERRLVRMSRISHARRRLELLMWRTSPLFCKTK